MYTQYVCVRDCVYKRWYEQGVYIERVWVCTRDVCRECTRGVCKGVCTLQGVVCLQVVCARECVYKGCV